MLIKNTVLINVFSLYFSAYGYFKNFIYFLVNCLSSCDPPQTTTPCDSQENTLGTDVTTTARLKAFQANPLVAFLPVLQP